MAGEAKGTARSEPVTPTPSAPSGQTWAPQRWSNDPSPTRRLTSPEVAATILRGDFEAFRRFIAFLVSGRILIAFRLPPQVGDMREAPDIEFRVADLRPAAPDRDRAARSAGRGTGTMGDVPALRSPSRRPRCGAASAACRRAGGAWRKPSPPPLPRCTPMSSRTMPAGWAGWRHCGGWARSPMPCTWNTSVHCCEIVQQV